MPTTTTHPATATEQAPPDIETMRATVGRLLDPDSVPGVLPPSADEVATLTATLRGHMELLAPEVERMAVRLHRDSIPRYCALACVGEARGRLKTGPQPAPSELVYARRLARSLNALCDHWETLGGVSS
ncbi:DUF6415 family natural product biosynthesis protein [Streptomyces sp. NPDC007896]|uniref:DUF6415 family natural product biosynthesis protein n=1 Tax=Streptomyces sp. NPDC007896 TaxID=3364784 RepID=UPI0036E4035E